jgi:uncharacterized protein with NRDE domain
MCLLLLALDAHPRYRLIAAANRDEFYARPTATLGWWDDDGRVLAGRDLEHRGTWMGVTREGRFAALTNFREAGARISGAPSRGLLVSEFLTGAEAADGFCDRLAGRAGEYNGFNLVVGDGRRLLWFSNRAPLPVTLEPGVHGLSNHLLGTPWPKLEGGLRDLRGCLQLEGEDLVEAGLELLSDRAIPPDDQLPDTGFGLEWERILAARFIVSPEYGTRSSSVLLIDRRGGGLFVEQSFDRGEPLGGPARIGWSPGAADR